MAANTRYVGICPLCGREVSTLADGVILRNHRPDPRKASALCMAWGLTATTFKRVETDA